jgi:hypothetical protein
MKKISSLLLLLIVALFLNSAVISGQTKTVSENSGLLYEISGKNLKKPSYLFGTIHLICQKDMFSQEKLKTYLDQTQQLMLEFDMDDPAAMQQAAKLAIMPGGKSVKDFVKPEEYAKIDELFKNYVGISFDGLQNFKPMTSQTFLLTSPKVLGCQPPVIYDNFLAQTATSQKMPVIGLETIEDQIAAIDSQSLEEQIKSLKETATNPEKGFGDFKTLYKTYLTQNSDDLYNLIATQFKAYNLSQTKMLDNRNLNWIPVIEKNIAEKPSFIAVGSGHLGGEKGVVKLLRAKGYKVTPIKL